MRTNHWSRYAWWVSVAAHLGLIAALWLWAGALSGFLITLPLLAALPGLIRRHSYTAGWLTLVLVFYVAALLAEAYSAPNRRAIALGLSELATLEFVALVLFVRFLARERKAGVA